MWPVRGPHVDSVAVPGLQGEGGQRCGRSRRPHVDSVAVPGLQGEGGQR